MILIDGIAYQFYWSAWKSNGLVSVLFLFFGSFTMIGIGIYFTHLYIFKLQLPSFVVLGEFLIGPIFTIILAIYFLYKKRYKQIFENHEEFDDDEYEIAAQRLWVFPLLSVFVPFLFAM